MRIVWASASFVAGVASAILLGFAPGYNVPTVAFAMFVITAILAVTALVLSRRRAATPLLCLVFLIAAWHGAGAIDDVENTTVGASVSHTSIIDSRNPFNRVRQFTGQNLNGALGASDTGLPTALLTGDRSEIGRDTTNNFRSAGLAHLLAISGLHVSLIGGIAMTASVFVFGRRHHVYLLIPLITVLIYAALAGFAPPITRAAIMFAVFILGRSMGRGSHTLAALALAALVMVALEPAIITSLSFQLSFAAMLGISFVSPVLEGFHELTTSNSNRTLKTDLFNRTRRFIIGSLAVSFAATVSTLPLVALHFDAVPIWGPFATLLAVPAIPVLIVASASLVLIAQLPTPWIIEIATLPVVATTSYLTWIAGFFSDLPPRPFETNSWTSWMVIAYYASLAALIPLWPVVTNVSRRFASALATPITTIMSTANVSNGATAGFIAALFLTGATGWVATLVSNQTNPHLNVRFLETDYGESIFIETPNGNRMLIDGGGGKTEVADILGNLLPLSDRQIDVVLLTHADADHVGGLPEVLRRFPVTTIIHSGISKETNIYESWSRSIENREDVHIAWQGLTLGLDQDVFVEVLSAGCERNSAPCSASNDTSIVTILRHGDISFLFTGDIEEDGEANLVSNHPDIRATVLKAPHHGSKTSSTQTMLDAVRPAIVVVSPGSANHSGHPHPTVLDRLKTSVGDNRVFRTDQLGTIELRTDGQRLWMVR